MSNRACEANRALAQEAVLLMTEECRRWNPRLKKGGSIQPPQSIFQLPTVQINRFIVCGTCERSGIPEGVVENLFRAGMEGVIHRVEIFREFGFDPEVSEVNSKKRKAQWREENKDYIAVRREAYRRDERIEKLKNLMGVDHDE